MPAAQVYPLFTMSRIDPRTAMPPRKVVLFDMDATAAKSRAISMRMVEPDGIEPTT